MNGPTMAPAGAQPSRMRRNALLAALALAGVAAAAWVGVTYFAPHASTDVMEELPAGARVVKTATFTGADSFHRVSGTVSLVDDDGRYYLHVADYEATDGPDVYYYLTPVGGYGADLEAASVKVLVPGGENGEATLRGDFNVEIPEGYDVMMLGGVAAWCDRFNVLFGDATF